MSDECRHERTKRGKDIPRVYGTYRSQVCIDCGMFRARDHYNKIVNDSRGAWRPAERYAEDTSERDDD